LLIIDASSGVPVYRQIMDQVRFQVAAGLLAPGAELPSTRSLSQELGVNPMTVSKAYGLLEEEGLAVRRPGLALVVADQGGASRELRHEQLRAALGPAARAVRQLGVPEAEAIEAFRQALKELTDVGEAS
jgi:GntR family transcriptional regulator